MKRLCVALLVALPVAEVAVPMPKAHAQGPSQLSFPTSYGPFAATQMMVPTPFSGAAILPSASGGAVSGLVLKAAPGNLYDVYATCTQLCWLQVFNSATVPASGAIIGGSASGQMQDCVPIAGSGWARINYNPGPMEFFSAGISAGISASACGTFAPISVGFIRGLAQ